jgi:uncharacterized protein YndB with AHSA1/START domain
MLKKILIGLAVILAGLLIAAAFQPNEFKVMRSATLSAPPAKVFALVNELKKWEAWSPWEKLDPAMKRTYEGPKAGLGAVYGWSGNNQVGEGRMTIIESKPSERVSFRMDFEKPMKDTCTADFTFKPEGKGTVVTWTMAGQNHYLSKVMCLFMDMDKMVGGQFEKGLAELEKAATAKK